jgi:hypothetical protein
MSRLAAGLEAAAALAAGAALAAAAFGPFQLELFGASVSVRTLSRPVIAAAILGVARIALSIAVRGAPAPATAPTVVGAIANAASRIALGAVIVASGLGWIVNLSTTVGGADSYGYVSAAERLRAGRLIEPEPLAALMPFPDGIAAATPLGYVPAGRVSNATVPAYPLGLPIVMAAARAIAGPNGPFGVAPLAAVILVAAAFVVARSWYDNAGIAALAAALTAANPLVFTYAIQPMSDVPAAAAMMTATALLALPRPWPLAAGLAAALALAIRPALAPAAAALAIVPLVATGRRDWSGARRYLVPIGAAAIAQGWSQWYLYGDPLASGYGSIRGLFSWSTASINASIYARWGVAALGLPWLAAAAIGLAASSDRRPRLVMAAVGGGVVVPYLFYRPYDHWETLRFLLPVIAVATAIAAFGLAAVARRVAGLAGPLVTAALTVLLAWTWWTWIVAHQVLTMPAHEARHRLAGDMVRQATPADAVVLALQHSGSLRYYADRPTLNWDRIPPGSLDATVKALQANGHRVYALIDSDEERAMFDGRHGAALGGWLPGGQRRSMQLFEAPAGALPLGR